MADDPEVEARELVVADEVGRRRRLADRRDAERQLLDLAGIVAAAAVDGRPVRLVGSDGQAVSGRVVESGPDVVVVDDDHGRPVVVPLDAVVTVHATRLTAVEASPSPDLHEVLLRWAEDRPSVVVRVAGGTDLGGVLEAVAEDLLVLLPPTGGESAVPLATLVRLTLAH